MLVACVRPLIAQSPTERFAELDRRYSSEIRALLKTHCLECHSTEKQEGELDLERFTNTTTIRGGMNHWLKVVEMVEGDEMPPRDYAHQLGKQKTKLLGWISDLMAAEAAATAGDPGPVILRRLNNVEYTNTIQALTGVPLEPAREFPTDSAAGEGFTNTGGSLVMSPAMLDKYFDAAKHVAEHAVLLPRDVRFSPYTTSRDLADDLMLRIRELYAKYTDQHGATRVNLQGLVWDTNQGGRLPVAPYIKALVEHRDALKSGSLSTDALAAEQKLNAKYLGILRQSLESPTRSIILASLADRIEKARPSDVPAIVEEITGWQNALNRFQSVGHMKPWIVPVSPLTAAQELRHVFKQANDAREVSLYLNSTQIAVGDASEQVAWRSPRLVRQGSPEILVRDLVAVTERSAALRQEVLDAAPKALRIAAELEASVSPERIDEAARREGIRPEVLSAWLDYLNIAPSRPASVAEMFTGKMSKISNYDFVSGWGFPETPSISANASDQHVRIPGNLKPHGIVVHPAPTKSVVIGWQSPADVTVSITGSITHAHPECGNGVTWNIQSRRGSRSLRLAAGIAAGGTPVNLPTIENVRVRKGELLAFVVGPRDGNHSCDLTNWDFEIREKVTTDSKNEARVWSVSRDLSPNILAANPHADSFGNEAVWHFGMEPISGAQENTPVLPPESLAARWAVTEDADLRKKFETDIAQLLAVKSGRSAPAEGSLPISPDDELWFSQISDVAGPLLGPLVDKEIQAIRKAEDAAGHSADLLSEAGQFVELKLPTALLKGRELIVTGQLIGATGAASETNGAVQLQLTLDKPASGSSLTATSPIVVNSQSNTAKALERALADVRQLFPAALCYMKIVPVDEVVTLTLFHREDEPLRRLMLGEEEASRLDELWEELHFVTHDAFTVQDAYEQLMQYATQDGDPKLFEPLREPINRRALQFKQELLDAEPHHLNWVLKFADQAFRRDATEQEREQLKSLYSRLRKEGLEHEDAIRLLIARVLVSPAFLYKLEAEPAGKIGPISSNELAVRLSYFLWSGPPDEELRQATRSSELQSEKGLLYHSRRMLRDERVTRLAREFACQWLQIQDIAELNEKSERHFPEFVEVRELLQEEAVRYFADVMQNDQSVLTIFDSDHTFVNERLAKLYGIDGVQGDAWRRVDGVRKLGRGGVLTFGATLAKQSGASRTSPILRGNWISEVLLGEKLPRPPKNVPPLPVDESEGELTVRQLTERHASDERCWSCHKRIDPFGYALERYDAIGRMREKDLAGHSLDTAVTLPDGKKISGAEELRSYLAVEKQSKLVRQFCRKLLGYSLGRAVQLSDEQLIAEMEQALARSGYRFSAAVDVVVTSPQFRNRRALDE
ncbi:MAG: DUF1592 domain-containing protein [Pirellulales bacterium]